MGKLSRRLTVKIEPMRGRQLSVTVQDSTTRTSETDRHLEADVATDIWSEEAAVEAFGLVLGGFVKSIKREDQSELFSGDGPNAEKKEK